MASTLTNQIPLGFAAPDFNLPDVISGNNLSLNELKGEKGTLIMVICNHCPYVKHVIDELVKISKEFQPKGISFIAINANDVENYPEDAPEKMKIFAKERNFDFPYLHDETQATAKAYFAACTPDFSLFDANLKCVYRGQLDDARPGNGKPINGKDLRNALDALLENKAPLSKQLPSIGCNIKWKKGNEPEWF